MVAECPCDDCRKLNSTCYIRGCERRREWEAQLRIYKELTKESRRKRGIGYYHREDINNE